MAPVTVVVLASFSPGSSSAYTNCVCTEGLHFSAFHCVMGVLMLYLSPSQGKKLSAAHEDADDGEVSDEDEAAEVDTSQLEGEKTEKTAAAAEGQGEGEKKEEEEGEKKEEGEAGAVKEGEEGGEKKEEGKTNGEAPPPAEAAKV